jgi:UbiD family decarboxylase
LPLIEVDCITHRKDPIWYATMEMEPPFDHNYMACMPLEGEVLSDLQTKIPEVQDVVVTPNLSYFVQLSVDGNKNHVLILVKRFCKPSGALMEDGVLQQN